LYNFPDVTQEYIPNAQKSKAANAFLTQRQSDTNPSNLFFTRDFMHYSQISDIRPVEGYKGYTVESVYWRNTFGDDCFGALYKPDEVNSLNSTTLYPLIFNYYEISSFGRYVYRNPQMDPSNINVPWYTSRGYAVFIPDIRRKKGKTGPAALSTIESAVEHLTNTYNWIDIKRIGGQGHSHGGYVTNYLATHSRVFAAAQSSAGCSDFISAYGQLGFGDASLQFMQEAGQNNLGTTPSKNPQVYIENSCIFSIPQVTTPLLLMHNKGDQNVPFAQAIELFTALRREQKHAWLLEYDNQEHVLVDRNDIVDFCTRQQQFFDHYLKGAPAPLWMVEGIPAKYKGIKSGLQSDSLNRVP
jgi:dipeptidyl aminopeptidase/acylaminoacyl peptidase